jgi:hypothetical protein
MSNAAASIDERAAALRTQIEAVRALLCIAPIEPAELPEALWDVAIARHAVAEELRSPGPFTAWRLGWFALYLAAEEREATLSLAIDHFEKLVPTPTGPGNDDGPFCDIAAALSLSQTRRALTIASAMYRAGWGGEASFAISVLAARLAQLGSEEEAMAHLEHDPERLEDYAKARAWLGVSAPQSVDVGAGAWNTWLASVTETLDVHRFLHELGANARRLDIPDAPALCGRVLAR